MAKPEDFLRQAKKLLGINVNPRSIEDVERVDRSSSNAGSAGDTSATHHRGDVRPAYNLDVDRHTMNVFPSESDMLDLLESLSNLDKWALIDLYDLAKNYEENGGSEYTGLGELEDAELFFSLGWAHRIPSNWHSNGSLFIMTERGKIAARIIYADSIPSYGDLDIVNSGRGKVDEFLKWREEQRKQIPNPNIPVDHDWR
jgi:hypothetical protein